MMRKFIKVLMVSVITCIILAALYCLILCYPQPFFRYKLTYENLMLYSDQPIPKEGLAVLKETQLRLERSEIYNPVRPHRIYICNNLYRFKLFTNKNNRVGGINYWLLNGNSFLRNSHIAKNRLVGPSGNEVPGDRTLVYYMTHEVMHAVTAQKTGRLAYAGLQVWIREGYADYIAKETFDFKENLGKFKSDVPELDPRKSGLYLRYNLLVAYELDIKKKRVNELLYQNLKQRFLDEDLRKYHIE